VFDAVTAVLVRSLRVHHVRQTHSSSTRAFFATYQSYWWWSTPVAEGVRTR